MNNAREFTGYNGIFATRLREIVETNKTTQAELAKHAGLTRQAISQYMDGSVLPNVEKLRKICSYFDIPSDYLLGLTESKSKDITDQHIQNKIGLSNEAIKNLEEVYRERLYYLFIEPGKILIIDFFNHMLSNKKFMANYPKRMSTYLEKIGEDDETAKKTGKFETSEDTDIASFLLSRLMQELADSWRNDFNKSKKKKAKQKPGRKRKEDVSDGNSTET